MSRPRPDFAAHLARCGLLVLALLIMPWPASALVVEQIESPGGVKAWLVEEHSVPLVALRFAFEGGAVQDPPGQDGLTSLMADLMTEAAGDLSSAAFKEQLAALGSKISISGGRDSLYGGMETLTARLQPSARLLRMMLTSPSFAPEDIARTKAQRISDLEQRASNPSKAVLDRWYAEAFRGHAYGRPIDGTPATLADMTREGLLAQHRRLLTRGALKVVITGDIGKAAAIELLDSVFGGLPMEAQLRPVDKAVPRAAPSPVVEEKELPLATAAFGLPSLPVDHPDYAALRVLNHIIGSGDFDSRLTEEIRVKRGLAYAIETALQQDGIASFVLGTFATKTENMGQALAVLKEVLATTARDGPTPTQFENARSYLAGSFLLDYDTSGKVAGSLLGIWRDGEGPEALSNRVQRIRSVRIDDVKRVAKQVLQTDKLLVTVVGKLPHR